MLGSIGEYSGAGGRVSLSFRVVRVVVVHELVAWKFFAGSAMVNIVRFCACVRVACSPEGMSIAGNASWAFWLLFSRVVGAASTESAASCQEFLFFAHVFHRADSLFYTVREKVWGLSASSFLPIFLENYGGGGLLPSCTEISSLWVPLAMFSVTVCPNMVCSSR